MKHLARAAALVFVSTAWALAAPADISGKWQFTVNLEMGTGRPVVTFEQDGETITGTYEGRYGVSKLEGTVKEHKVEFTIAISAEGSRVSGYFSGEVDGDRMKGEVEYEGAGEGTWTAVRMGTKQALSAAPR